MIIFPYSPEDFDVWFFLAYKLYPNMDATELRKLLMTVKDKPHQQIYFAGLSPADESSTIKKMPIAYIRVTLRHDYVEGASSSPTCYIEGIYVEPAHRKSGIARKLFQAAELWAKSKGCIEIGSDTWVDNLVARKFHIGVGFEEDDVLVHYIKRIDT